MSSRVALPVNLYHSPGFEFFMFLRFYPCLCDCKLNVNVNICGCQCQTQQKIC
jgi:hypothetical protein